MREVGPNSVPYYECAIAACWKTKLRETILFQVTVLRNGFDHGIEIDRVDSH